MTSRFLSAFAVASLYLLPAPLFAQSAPFLLAPDAAWCWFGNPRAIFKDGKMYFGYVRFADGRSCLNVFNPATTNSTLLFASDMAEKDDHNNPALLELNDGRLLAIYQKHNTEQRFYSRLTQGGDPSLPGSWGPEIIGTNTGAGITYANPYQLSTETNRVFSFARNLNFNPTFFLSDSSASNWSAPKILIRTGSGGTRPYVQYCSDFARRIDFTYTDAHPDAAPCSLYHAYYQEGALRQSDGTFLKNLADAPLLHDSGERGSVIYQYSTAPTNDFNAHIPSGRAWCWDLVYKTNDAPVAVFSVQLDNAAGPNWFDDRLYYYYARWTGTNWQKRFIAQAGRPLYDTQTDYAGGITVDPSDANVIYLSSNAADPFNLSSITNVPLRANSRYEIWRGVTTNGGLNFAWQALTTNSLVDNLRPYVPRKNPYPVGVVWYAGTYTSYTSWDTAMVGWFGTNVPAFSVTANHPPIVNLLKPASSPILLTNLANHLRLQASVTDDGAGPLTKLWSTVTGPASAVFANASDANTSVKFPQPGVYVLRLSASDGFETNSANLTVFAGVPATPPTDASLVLWLKLDELSGSQAVDSSGNINHGTPLGGTTWQPGAGVRAGAIATDGASGFVSVPDAPTLDNTSAFTLAYWFRASNFISGGAGLVSKRNTLSDNNAYTTFLQANRFINVDIDGTGNRFASVTPIETNVWYHVAVTFNGALPSSERARLYLNGVIDRVAAESSSGIPDFNSTLKIGLTHSNATTFLTGAFDDVRFYRRALNDVEVAALAALKQTPTALAGPAPNATNLIPAALAGSTASDGLSGPLTSRWSTVTGPGAVTFANSNSPSTSVTFSNRGDYLLRLSAADSAAEVFAELAVTAAPNPNWFTDWQALVFPGQTNLSVIAPNANPDNDRANNFTEFALGLNATAADTLPFSVSQPGFPVGAIQSFSGTNYLVLRVRRPIGRLQVTYAAQVSGDLQTWTSAVLTAPPVNNGDGSETLTFRDVIPLPQAARYARLLITGP